ncbi:hypothetical protein RQP46_010945 [Phenoliferia psychrophenolica]
MKRFDQAKLERGLRELAFYGHVLPETFPEVVPDRVPCAKCKKPLTKKERKGCSNCRTSVAYYCSAKCQKNDWTHHKKRCISQAQIDEQIELKAMAQARSGNGKNALEAYVDARDPEYTTAACSALRLHHSVTLERTHVLVVYLRHNWTIKNPAHAFTPFRISVVPISKIDNVVASDFCGQSLEPPISFRCRLEGMDIYSGLRTYSNSANNKFMMFFAAVGAQGATDFRMRGVAKRRLTRTEVGEKLWAARNDANWKENLEARIKTSTAYVKGGLSEQEEMRRELLL